MNRRLFFPTKFTLTLELISLIAIISLLCQRLLRARYDRQRWQICRFPKKKEPTSLKWLFNANQMFWFLTPLNLENVIDGNGRDKNKCPNLKKKKMPTSDVYGSQWNICLCQQLFWPSLPVQTTVAVSGFKSAFSQLHFPHVEED